ncbi:MAG: alpha/beta hydrolase family protein, partial [Solirubrobacterales bacterium]
LLAGALAGGAAAALAGAPTALATQPGDASKTRKRPAATFFAEPALNFQMLFALSASGYGASETGEVLSAFDRIHGKGDTLRAVFDEFQRLGRQLRARGDEERAAGRDESARLCYLRAAMYLDQALFYVLASANPTRHHEGVLYREMEKAWASAAALFRPRFEPVEIPYGAGHLPGWFLGPGGKARRPTVILNTGSDAQNIDMYVYGGAAALERGWNALIFEGPGQGSRLFLHNEAFIPEWERVITPVVSYLRAHPRVDRRRISLAGQSFGGYLTPRAAAYEHRLAGLVTDPGAHDCFLPWAEQLKSLVGLLDAGARDEFNRIWNDDVVRKANEYERVGLAKRLEIYGNGQAYEQLKLAQRFKLDRATARRITAPVAVLSPQLEQFFPGQAKTLHEWIGKDRSTLIPFTIAEGGEYHCEPMAPQLRNERVYDWLETHARH